MTLGEHLEDLRRMLVHILVAVAVCAAAVFCMKERTFGLLLAPKEWDFVTYRAIERLAAALGVDFRFEPFRVDLISTELSAQFMTHLSASVALGALLASPYILYRLFLFVSPALYEGERRYAVPMVVSMYVLFVAGVLLSYFLLFPIAFRFLGTYQVAGEVRNVITLDSYISTFTSLTLLLGLVFQLPVVAFVLARLGLISAPFLARYRRHAVVLILIAAAVITPPDAFTLVLVSVPLWLLYEACIWIVRHAERK